MADPTLNIRIAGDLTAIKQSLAALQKDFGTLGDKLSTAGKRGEQGLSGMESALVKARQAVTGLVAGFGILQSIRLFVRITDDAKAMQAQLTLATHSAEEFQTAQEETYKVALRTRTAVTDTVKLYAAIERATRGAGANQAEVLRLTETINKAAQISGGGQSAADAIRQLLQGLSSGVLRGEELNSVLEQAPRLAQAIADGLGVPIGKLRELGAQGKITGNDLRIALGNQAKQIDEEFKKIPLSISGAFTNLQSAFAKFVTQTDDAAGASRELAEAIDSLARNLPTVIQGVLALAAAWASLKIIRSTLTYITAAQAELLELSTVMRTTGENARAFGLVLGSAFRVAASTVAAFFAGWEIGTTLKEQFIEVELLGLNMVKNLLIAWERLKQGTAIAAEAVKQLWIGAFNLVRVQIASTLDLIAAAAEKTGFDDIATKTKELAKAVRPATSAYEDFGAAVDKANADASASIDHINNEFDDMAAVAVAARLKVDKATAGTPTTPSSSAAKPVLDNAALLKDAVDRQLRELDRLYADGKVRLEDYFEKKRELQNAALDADILEAKQQLAKADKLEEQSKALTKLAILERQRGDIALQSTHDQAEAQKELGRTLEDIQARIAEGSGDHLATRLLQIQREREDLLKKFANDPGASVLINKLFDVDKAKARADAIKAEADRLIRDLQNLEGSISQQISAGVISQATGEEQLRAARDATIAQLIKQRDLLQEVYNTAPSPEVLAAIQEFNKQIGDVATRNASGMERAMINLRSELAKLQEDFTGNTISALQDGLANLFTSIADGSKSAGEALKDFVRGFAQSMLQLASRALATYLLLSMLDSIYPGLGKATAAAMGAGAKVQHTGGIVGRSGITRIVNPAIFAGAPRYHWGGVAGMGPDEVPAILQKGEEVLAKNDPRNVMNGGGNTPAPGTRVVNVFDASFVPDQMDSAAGERVILNVIGKNPGRVKQILG